MWSTRTPQWNDWRNCIFPSFTICAAGFGLPQTFVRIGSGVQSTSLISFPQGKTRPGKRRTTMANQNQNQNQSGQSGRGFASMDEGKQREIASKGGVASHERGTAHEFTPEEAREAGRKG